MKPWTPAQRRISSERAYFANTGTFSWPGQPKPFIHWDLSLMSWVNRKDTWPLWDDYLDCCRTVAKARGLAPVGLSRELLPRTV